MSPSPSTLILASASPRRRELLERLGLKFEVHPADVDETPHPGEAPRAYVLRVAQSKAAHVAKSHPGARVLSADTTVVLEGEILGKPRDAEDARRMLTRLSDRDHVVLSAVALDGPHRDAVVVETRVSFRALPFNEIEWYIRTGEPMDKAGAYGIQGLAGMFVRAIEGSASNVVGLPLAETIELLTRAGHPLPWSAP
ncbi:MAG: Maf family protein [Myxococcaceae bacterium]